MQELVSAPYIVESHTHPTTNTTAALQQTVIVVLPLRLRHQHHHQLFRKQGLSTSFCSATLLCMQFENITNKTMVTKQLLGLGLIYSWLSARSKLILTVQQTCERKKVVKGIIAKTRSSLFLYEGGERNNCKDSVLSFFIRAFTLSESI